MSHSSVSSWFRSVVNRAPDPLRGVERTTERWNDVPLPRAAPPWGPPATRADDDGDWEAVIARAKMRAEVSPPRRSPPPPLRPVAVSPPPDEDWDVAIRRAKAQHRGTSSPSWLHRR